VAGAEEWVLLSYRLPREPSTVRVAVWRRLRRLGAVQVLDGLVALPADPRTREQLEWVAGDVVDAGGEALVWVGRLATRAQHRAVAARMAEAVADEYRAIGEAAGAAAALDDAGRRRALRRLRRDLQRVAQRDFFPPDERERARRAVEALADGAPPAPVSSSPAAPAARVARAAKQGGRG
jgi:hypothetical protein